MQLDDFTHLASEIILNSVRSAQKENKSPLPEFVLLEMIEHKDSPVLSVLVSHKIDKDSLLNALKHHLSKLGAVPTQESILKGLIILRQIS